MSLHRRDGIGQGWFSDGRRDDRHGGDVPLEWRAPTVDLDALGMQWDGCTYCVDVHGRIFVQYDEKPYTPISLVFACERKNPGENLGWGVTRALGRLSGLPAYRLAKRADGSLLALRDDGAEREFKTIAAFVDATHVKKRTALAEDAA